MCLGAVLDQGDVAGAAKRLDPVEIGRLAIQMHDHDRADGRQPGRRVFQHAVQCIGVHCEVDGVDIDQQGRRPGHLDRGHSRHGGVRHGDDGAAGSDAQSAQGERNCVGAIAAADGVRQAKPGGEFSLEGATFVAQDIPAG